MTHLHSRRSFLAVSLGLLLATPPATLPASALRGAPARRRPGHPTPRRGITAARVPRREQLAGAGDAAPVFDMVREIPEVVDGIGCNCGCAAHADFYSLLTCYEGPDAMAKQCQVCQAQGRLVYRLHRAGKSLEQIRKGIDARFG